jgi:hypothetical protein
VVDARNVGLSEMDKSLFFVLNMFNALGINKRAFADGFADLNFVLVLDHV